MTDWITHDSIEPPELAPAARVEVWIFTRKGDAFHTRKDRVSEIPWNFVDRYRPLTDDEGHKLISAEGLHPNRHWVVTQPNGMVLQYRIKPYLYEGGWYSGDGSARIAPDEFAHPGYWRDSLYRAEGK